MNSNDIKYQCVPRCLKDYLLVDTSSLERAHDVAAASFVPHKLNLLSAPSSFHFIHSDASLQNISLCYTSYDSELILEPEAMDEFYLIQIPVKGMVQIESGGKRLEISGKQGSVVSPTNHTRFMWSQGAGLITIKVERQALELQLKRLNQSELKHGIEFDLGMCLGEPEYRDWYIEIVRLMHYFQYAKSSGPESLVLESWFEQKLMELLLFSHPNNYSPELTQSSFQAPSKSVKRAIEYMHARIDEKITLGTLASVTGVTARTLHNGFKHFCNVSPMCYLADIRLQKVRSELKKSHGKSNVTSIAQGAGFTHLGRFSQSYFRQFGERPSETLSKV